MNRRSRLVSASLALALAAGASAQWNPNAGQWGKSDPRDVRVMTWNVLDGICRTNNKVEDLNNWAALARIVAAMKPDILLLQETGDNSGNGTGSGVDSTSQLNTTLGYFFNGGNDSFKSNAPITSWVKKYAPTFDIPVHLRQQPDRQLQPKPHHQPLPVHRFERRWPEQSWKHCQRLGPVCTRRRRRHPRLCVQRDRPARCQLRAATW
jgi:hypothetical protein